ncbi:hypothetical protein SDC9_123568 [bioreactor metagenome]|uniref:Uncharacterized protein n=1 Tax=bioreactor metagenome TaxID=1076179 RepID=A0A645CI17_9ZZZZ
MNGVLHQATTKATDGSACSAEYIHSCGGKFNNSKMKLRIPRVGLNIIRHMKAVAIGVRIIGIKNKPRKIWVVSSLLVKKIAMEKPTITSVVTTINMN